MIKFLKVVDETCFLCPQFLVEIKDTPLYGDVVFSPDKKSVIASRFFLQSSRIRDAKEDVGIVTPPSPPFTSLTVLNNNKIVCFLRKIQKKNFLI